MASRPSDSHELKKCAHWTLVRMQHHQHKAELELFSHRVTRSDDKLPNSSPPDDIAESNHHKASAISA